MDKKLISMRESKFQDEKMATFKRMYEKHPLYSKLIGKKLSEILSKDRYSQALYDINKSITQSYRCRAGKCFEECVEYFLQINNISYGKQVFIGDDGVFYKTRPKTIRGHRVDFVVPSPIYGTRVQNHQGTIVSCKTSLRERVLQDLYLGKILVITLDKALTNSKIQVCRVNAHTRCFEKQINDWARLYSVSRAVKND
jgi:hypothetical protein